MNVADRFDRQAAEAPSATAIVDGPRATTYGELASIVDHAAARFAAAGWDAGMTIAVALRRPAAVQLATMLALARIGTVQLLLDSHEPRHRRDAAIRRFGVRGLVAHHRPPDGAIPVVVPGASWHATGTAPRAPGLRFAGGDAPWIIVETSGTTDLPKAMAIAHSVELARSALQPAFARARPGERVLSLIGPEFRSGRSVALRCLSLGATYVAVPRDAAAPTVIDLVEASAPAILIATPSQLAGLLPHLPEGPPRFPQIRMLRTNSGAMSPTLLDRVRARLTPNVHVDYGTNDCGTIAIATPADLDRHPRTVGRPLAGIELEIVDDRDVVRPAGAPGRIRLRSPGSVSGYLGDRDATASAFREGWYHPGDIGVLNEEGLLFVHGRVDAVMNFGGIKISPAEIEAAALAHPGVAEAHAFPVPSARFESVPAIAVVRHPGADVTDLRERLADRLGLRAPRHLLELDALPRDSLGKVSRRRLLALLRRRRAGAQRGASSRDPR